MLGREEKNSDLDEHLMADHFYWIFRNADKGSSLRPCLSLRSKSLKLGQYFCRRGEMGDLTHVIKGVLLCM